MAGIEVEIAAQALSCREVEDGLDAFTAEVVEYAQSIAPEFGDLPPHRVAPAEGEPGDYKESIHAEHLGVGARRVISRDDPIAFWVEMGTRHMPEYAVFAKTAEHFGGTAPEVGGAGVAHAQSHLREAITRLEELHAGGAAAHEIAAQKARVRMARQQRSAEFKAAAPKRSRRRGKSGRGRR